MADETVDSPWGNYTSLDKGLCYPGQCWQVKRIVVKPKQRLSLQYHHHRSEIWIFLEGEGIVQVSENHKKVKEDDFKKVKAGDTAFIPLESTHRLTNTSDKDDLVMIEVQVGDNVKEDDIVRLTDDYGRVE